jgi:hypothetical protein
MADNVNYTNPGTGTVIGVDSCTVNAVAGVGVPLGKTGFGANDSWNYVTATVGLPSNVVQVGGSAFALGQQLAAASLPVVLTAAQLSTLTPLTSVGITGSVAVTGTFFQATQPVSLASSVAVTGTFWQATQPVSGTFWQATQPVSIATLPALAAGSATIGNVGVAATTSGGATPYHYVSAGSANQDAQQIKSSAGQVYSISASNGSASTRYLKVYNVAAPTSASTPIGSYILPAGGGNNVPLPMPLACSTAIAIRITTGLADNDTGAASAGDVSVNIGYA